MTLIDESVELVTPDGVVSRSGATYDADVLVWATGFQASRFISTLDIIGTGGVTLRETWDDDDPRAYLGVSVPGIPTCSFWEAQLVSRERKLHVLHGGADAVSSAAS